MMEDVKAKAPLFGGLALGAAGAVILNEARQEPEGSKRQNKLTAVGSGLIGGAGGLGYHHFKTTRPHTSKLMGLSGIIGGTGAAVYSRRFYKQRNEDKLNKEQMTKTSLEKSASITHHLNNTVPRALTVGTGLGYAGLGGYLLYRSARPKDTDSKYFTRKARNSGIALMAIGTGGAMLANQKGAFKYGNDTLTKGVVKSTLAALPATGIGVGLANGFRGQANAQKDRVKKALRRTRDSKYV